MKEGHSEPRFPQRLGTAKVLNLYITLYKMTGVYLYTTLYTIPIVCDSIGNP